jgi:hypothetical protein
MPEIASVELSPATKRLGRSAVPGGLTSSWQVHFSRNVLRCRFVPGREIG